MVSSAVFRIIISALGFFILYLIIACQEKENSNQLINAVVHGQQLDTGEHNCNIDTLRNILLNGIDINAVNEYGNTALHYAAWACWGELANDSEVVQILVDHGASIHAKNKKGMEPIHGAEAAGTRILLRLGVDPNVRSSDGQTALFYADECDVVSILVEAGAEVNARDNNSLFGPNATALHRAAFSDDPELIACLIKYGVDPTLANDYGYRPIDIAIKLGNKLAEYTLLQADEIISAK